MVTFVSEILDQTGRFGMNNIEAVNVLIIMYKQMVLVYLLVFLAPMAKYGTHSFIHVNVLLELFKTLLNVIYYPNVLMEKYIILLPIRAIVHMA